jgi:hypothetical protein
MDYFIKQGISPAAAAQLAQRISKTAEPPPPISNGIKMHPQDGAMNLLVNKYGLRPEDAQTFLSGMYNSRSKNYTPTDAPPETALQRAGDRVYYERTTGHMHGTKESDELTALAKQETQRLASMAEYARNEKPSYAFATGSDPNADSGGE